LPLLTTGNLQAATQRGDLEAMMRLMRLRAEAIMRQAMQLSRDASQLRGEVLITDAVLARGACETLAIVLHEAAHTLATHRGVTDTSSHGRYHKGSVNEAVTRGKVASNSGELAGNRRTPTP
jgi:hypothetical protein